MNSLPPLDSDTREAAADWAVRLDDQAPLSQVEQRQLQCWLEADPQNAQALKFARQTWSALAQSPAVPVPSAIRRAAPARRINRRLRRGMAVAALVLLGLASIEPAYQASIPLRADYSTTTGERLSIQLPDGSQATLDSHSAIQLDYGSQRHVRLLKGQVIFAVAPMTGSERRPFVVSSQGVQTRALGTRFVVSQRPGEGAWVGVQEHAVNLSSARQSLILETGESARIHQDGSLSRGQLDLHRATSWQRGLLVFERAPLAQVVSELNRYRKGHIIISPGSLSQREVSGVFRLDSLDATLASLGSELGIQHREIAGLTLLY